MGWIGTIIGTVIEKFPDLGKIFIIGLIMGSVNVTYNHRVFALDTDMKTIMGALNAMKHENAINRLEDKISDLEKELFNINLIPPEKRTTFMINRLRAISLELPKLQNRLRRLENGDTGV